MRMSILSSVRQLRNMPLIHSSIPALSRETKNRARADFLVVGARESTVPDAAFSCFEKTFSLVVHTLLSARMVIVSYYYSTYYSRVSSPTYFYYPMYYSRVSSPTSTAATNSYARPCLRCWMYPDSGSHEEYPGNRLPELLHCKCLEVRWAHVWHASPATQSCG